MKKFLLALIIFWGAIPFSAQAFYGIPQIKRLSYRVELASVDAEFLEVKLTQELQNTGKEKVVFPYEFPIQGREKEVSFFVDALAQPFKILKGSERLEYLFDRAKEKKFPLFFRLGAPPFESLLVTNPVEIPSEASITLKLVYHLPVDFVNDFYFTEVFLQDDLKTEDFQLSVRLASSGVLHFFTNLPSYEKEVRADGGLAFSFSQKDFLPQENVRIFWSFSPRPLLRFQSKGEIYQGIFESPPLHPPLKEALFILDASGSMSGGAFERAVDYIGFLLENLPQDMEFRLVLWDDEIRFYKPEKLKNIYQNKKELIPFLQSLKPSGKGTLEALVNGLKEKEVWEVSPDQRAVFLFTDSLDFVPYESGIFASPLLLFSFEKEESLPLRVWAELSGGWTQKLFRSPVTLLESRELLNRLGDWKSSLSVTRIENISDLVPRLSLGLPASGPIWVGRTFEPFEVLYAPASRFIPSLWAARRLGEMLMQETPSQESLEAMLSIAHRFGIRRGFINPENSFTEFESAFKATSALERQRLSLELKAFNFGFFSTEKRIKEVPLYFSEKDGVWRSYDFFEVQSPHTLLKIAPFSQAQRFLFLHYPEWVAEGFSYGEKVDFCTEIRCISVFPGARESESGEDRLFFRDYDPTFWGNPYLGPLVNQGLLKAEENGRLHPHRPMDRGTFARILASSVSGEDLKNLEDPAFFSDIKAGDESFEAVQWLRRKGIIKGYGDGTFRPFQSLTRAEGVKMILALKGFTGDEISSQESAPFSDLGGWETPWVVEAYRRGMVKGFPDGTFRPHQTLTRAEAAKLWITGK